MRSFIVALSIVSALGSRALAQSELPPAAPSVASTPASPETGSATQTPTSTPAATTGGPARSVPTIAAQPAPATRGASVWGILPWGGIGVGARYMISLPISPLLSSTSVRDNFTLEFGADLLRWSYGQDTLYSSSYTWTEVLPVVGMSWNFWFSDRFALYPKLEAGYAFGWLSNSIVGEGGYGGTFVNGAGGLLYKLSGGLALRAEVGSSGLKVGAGWLF
jgi:hypothetical protein